MDRIKILCILALSMLACSEESHQNTSLCSGMYISPAIPIQFWSVDCETFNEKEVCTITPACFCQPWNCDDEIKIQFTENLAINYKLSIRSEENEIIHEIEIPVSDGVYNLSFIPSEISPEICNQKIQLFIIQTSISQEGITNSDFRNGLTGWDVNPDVDEDNQWVYEQLSEFEPFELRRDPVDTGNGLQNDIAYLAHDITRSLDTDNADFTDDITGWENFGSGELWTADTPGAAVVLGAGDTAQYLRQERAIPTGTVRLFIDAITSVQVLGDSARFEVVIFNDSTVVQVLESLDLVGPNGNISIDSNYTITDNGTHFGFRFINSDPNLVTHDCIVNEFYIVDIISGELTASMSKTAVPGEFFTFQVKIYSTSSDKEYLISEYNSTVGGDALSVLDDIEIPFPGDQLRFYIVGDGFTSGATSIIMHSIDFQTDDSNTNYFNLAAKKSDCLHIKQSHTCTQLIHYSHHRNYAGIVYEEDSPPDFSPEFQFSIRVPATFFHERFPEEDTVMELSDRLVSSNGSIRSQKLLEIQHVPYFFHKKLQLILKHSNVIIDDQNWVKQEGYEIDSGGNRRFPLKKATCYLTERDFVVRNIL